MFARLKQLWSVAPWYLKIVLTLVAVLALFLPVDFVHSVLDGLDRKKTDEAVQKLEAAQQVDDQNAALDQGKLQQLEQQKADISKQETDDAVDYFNSIKLPPK